MSCLGYALRRAARARAVSLVITGPESSFVIPIDRHQRWCRGANPSRTASASGGAAPGFRRWSLKPSPGVAGIHSACVARSALNDDTKHTNIHQAPAPTAVLALGSNQGDRVGVFRESYRLLNARGIFVVSHAGLYETEPQYVTDQPVFLNSACLVSIQDKDIGDCPQKLLAVLKQIEKQLGRVESGARFGPRPMDLDILFHSSGAHKTESLEIPHPRIHERDFVLAPLADLEVGCCDRPGADGVESRSVDSQSGVSNNSAKSDAIQAGLRSAKQTWRDRGGETNVGKKGLKRVLPLGKENTLTQVGGATKIMGILNVTHDSFSGDGVLGEGGCDSNRNNESVEDFWNPVDLGKIVARASAMVKNGARVVDVGGQSTRPGAVRLSKQEELRRVLPVVKALAALFQREEFQHRGGENVPLISVDTFYGDVAFEAVNAGADIINDVSGGTLCPDMFRSIASTKAPVPYICMHMRGDPSTMQSAENTAYVFGDVPLVVGRELSARVAATTESGVEPWRIWLDPGIGFAKSHDGNWDLLGNLDRVRETLKTNGSGCVANAPMLVGVSRKGFLGAATGHKNATDRDRATAAACAVAIAGGADIVRVHDVQAVVDAVKVADQVRLARARTKHTRE